MSLIQKKIDELENIIRVGRVKVEEMMKIDLEDFAVTEEVSKRLGYVAASLSDLTSALNNVRHVMGVEMSIQWHMRVRWYAITLREGEKPSLDTIYGLNANYNGPWSERGYADKYATKMTLRHELHKLSGPRKAGAPKHWMVASYDPKTNSWDTYPAPAPNAAELAEHQVEKNRILTAKAQEAERKTT